MQKEQSRFGALARTRVASAQTSVELYDDDDDASSGGGGGGGTLPPEASDAYGNEVEMTSVCVCECVRSDENEMKMATCLVTRMLFPPYERRE